MQSPKSAEKYRIQGLLYVIRKTAEKNYQALVRRFQVDFYAIHLKSIRPGSFADPQYDRGAESVDNYSHSAEEKNSEAARPGEGGAALVSMYLIELDASATLQMPEGAKLSISEREPSAGNAADSVDLDYVCCEQEREAACAESLGAEAPKSIAGTDEMARESTLSGEARSRHSSDCEDQRPSSCQDLCGAQYRYLPDVKQRFARQETSHVSPEERALSYEQRFPEGEESSSGKERPFYKSYNSSSNSKERTLNGVNALSNNTNSSPSREEFSSRSEKHQDSDFPDHENDSHAAKDLHSANEADGASMACEEHQAFYPEDAGVDADFGRADCGATHLYAEDQLETARMQALLRIYPCNLQTFEREQGSRQQADPGTYTFVNRSSELLSDRNNDYTAQDVMLGSCIASERTHDENSALQTVLNVQCADEPPAVRDPERCFEPTDSAAERLRAPPAHLCSKSCVSHDAKIGRARLPRYLTVPIPEPEPETLCAKSMAESLAQGVLTSRNTLQSKTYSQTIGRVRPSTRLDAGKDRQIHLLESQRLFTDGGLSASLPPVARVPPGYQASHEAVSLQCMLLSRQGDKFGGLDVKERFVPFRVKDVRQQSSGDVSVNSGNSSFQYLFRQIRGAYTRLYVLAKRANILQVKVIILSGKIQDLQGAYFALLDRLQHSATPAQTVRGHDDQMTGLKLARVHRQIQEFLVK